MALQLYETMFLYSPELAETAVKKEIETLKKRITEKSGGEISFEDFWGKRDLAYPIEKMDSGFYIVLQYTFPSEELSAFDEELRLDQNILRFLTIKPEKDSVPTKYSDILKEEEEFVSEKVAGKRRVRRAPRRVEKLEEKK